MDFDAIVVGAGPAGLSAATALAGAKRRVLVLERESFGGQVANLEWIEDYPVRGQRIGGPALANRLVEDADRQGVERELREVVEIEAYSGCVSVGCEDGKAYTASVVLIAGGRKPRPLGIPGEDRFQGKGVIHCAFCDGGLYTDKVVAVCGGGDAALKEALYLSKFASKVHVIEAQAALSAATALQEKARAHPKLDIRYGRKAVEVLGGDGVTALALADESGRREQLDVYGVLAQVGFLPATAYLEGVVPLDDGGYVEVDVRFRTEAPGVLAAGDIRSASPHDVAAAISDGKAAAESALLLLR